MHQIISHVSFDLQIFNGAKRVKPGFWFVSLYADFPTIPANQHLDLILAFGWQSQAFWLMMQYSCFKVINSAFTQKTDGFYSVLCICSTRATIGERFFCFWQDVTPVRLKWTDGAVKGTESQKENPKGILI